MRCCISIIVVIHVIPFAREVVDVVFFLYSGRVVDQGRPEQVLDAPQHDRTRAFLARVL